jgi:hypothetical protein
MSGRAPFLRMLAMAFATLQLVSPALVVIADGASVRDAVAESVAHVESAGSKGCPQVHAPDCALCRYLCGASTLLPDSAIAPPLAGRTMPPAEVVARPRTASTLLPHGRAPPLG